MLRNWVSLQATDGPQDSKADFTLTYTQPQPISSINVAFVKYILIKLHSFMVSMFPENLTIGNWSFFAAFQ